MDNVYLELNADDGKKDKGDKGGGSNTDKKNSNKG